MRGEIQEILREVEEIFNGLMTTFCVMSIEDLREVVREEVRKTLLQAFLALTPYVSEEEQKEIEEEMRDFREDEMELEEMDI